MTASAAGPVPASASSSSTGRPRGVLASVGQILAVLVVLIVIFSLANPGAFLSVSNFRSIAQNIAILAVLGVGATFVIVTSGIDLSIGSVLVFSSVVSAKAMTLVHGGQGGLAAVVGIVVAIVAGAAWGFVNGIFVAHWKVPPLIVTLGSMGAALGLAEVMTNGVDIRASNDVLTNDIGYGNVFGQFPTLVAIAIVIVAVGAFILHKTKFGKYTYAVGSNEEGARRSGIAVKRHLVKVYVLSGALAGVGGVLSIAFFQTTTLSGQSNTALNVIAGVVIGGTSLFGGVGTIIGTVIGLCIPAVLQAGFVIVGVQSYWQQVVVGAVLVAAVLIDQRRRERQGSGGTRRFWQRRRRT